MWSGPHSPLSHDQVMRECHVWEALKGQALLASHGSCCWPDKRTSGARALPIGAKCITSSAALPAVPAPPSLEDCVQVLPCKVTKVGRKPASCKPENCKKASKRSSMQPLNRPQLPCTLCWSQLNAPPTRHHYQYSHSQSSRNMSSLHVLRHVVIWLSGALKFHAALSSGSSHNRPRNQIAE